MSQFWEQRLVDIRERLLTMSALTERSFSQSIRALLERDDKLCDAVEAGDSRVDALEVEVDEMVITFMATHAPTARDCRMMLAASKISQNLERIADEATKIARRSRELNMAPALRSFVDISSVAELAQTMLHDSISAFVEGDLDKSVDIVARDRSVDEMKKQIERELTGQMIDDPKSITRALHLLTVARAIERVADHATNIAEEVFYFYKAQDIRHDPSIKGVPPPRRLDFSEALRACLSKKAPAPGSR